MVPDPGPDHIPVPSDVHVNLTLAEPRKKLDDIVMEWGLQTGEENVVIEPSETEEYLPRCVLKVPSKGKVEEYWIATMPVV